MTPDQLVARLKKGGPPPAILLLGADAYGRDRSRAALLDAALPGEDRENGLAHFDLNEAALADVVDDARSLALFARQRLILVANSESALPRQKSGDENEDIQSAPGGAGSLEDYLKDPSPGVTIVFEASRLDWDTDDKKKLERVRKFYARVADVVELRRPSLDDARAEALALAKRAGLQIDHGALELLVESLSGDVARIAVEIEKLRLFAAGGQTIGEDDISALVPDARATTIFALVNALGRRDRRRSFQILDTLVREGEYLPLALSFLATQFRLALVSLEAGLRSAGQIQGYFSKAGVPMWGSRAEQVQQTATRFTKGQLEQGIRLLFAADRDLRDARPDDRVVMERLILALTP